MTLLVGSLFSCGTQAPATAHLLKSRAPLRGVDVCRLFAQRSRVGSRRVSKRQKVNSNCLLAEQDEYTCGDGKDRHNQGQSRKAETEQRDHSVQDQPNGEQEHSQVLCDFHVVHLLVRITICNAADTVRRGVHRTQSF